MCITQSRRRKSLGLNLAAYAAAYQKPSRGQETSSRGARSYSVLKSTFTTNGIGKNNGTTAVVDQDGTTFAAVAFPDPPAISQNEQHKDDLASSSVLESVALASMSVAAPAATTTVPAASVSYGDEFKPLEGKYVQGVYIPPSKPKPKRVRKPQKPGKTAKMHERHFVKHNYHDHSSEVPTGDEPSLEAVEAAVLGQKKCGTGKKGEKVSISFPRKLHFLLDQIEQDGLAHVISWLPHGRAFAVHNAKEFTDYVMPKYFNQSKLTSFQRQLNLYGFCRLTRGRDSGGYYNEHFLRGMPFLTKNIVRTRIKGTKFKAASNPDAEPNFYAMRPVSLPSRHPLAKNVASLVSASEESSTTSSLSSSAGGAGSVGSGILKRASPINPPNQVVVPSVNTAAAAAMAASFPEALSLSPVAANHSGAAAAVTGRTKVSICDLWDSLDVFEPNPYRSPKSSPQASPLSPAKAAVPPPALWEQPMSMDITPAVVTAPPSRRDSGDVAVPPHAAGVAASTASAAPSSVSPGQSNDPLLDLVESWATSDDDFMADVIDQALDNDHDFGHYLLDVIGHE